MMNTFCVNCSRSMPFDARRCPGCGQRFAWNMAEWTFGPPVGLKDRIATLPERFTLAERGLVRRPTDSSVVSPAWRKWFLIGGPQVKDPAAAVRMYLRELGFWAEVKDRGLSCLPYYYGTGAEQPRGPYLVTADVPGHTVHDLVLDPRPDAWCREFLAAALRALGELHRAGYVHGNIRPVNVLVKDDGKGFLSVVFVGMSRVRTIGKPYTAERPTSEDRLWSPNPAEWDEPSTSTDVYSLGVTTANLMADSFDPVDLLDTTDDFRVVGNRVHEVERVRRSRFRDVLCRMNSFAREGRYGTVDEVLRDLGER